MLEWPTRQHVWMLPPPRRPLGLSFTAASEIPRMLDSVKMAARGLLAPRARLHSKQRSERRWVIQGNSHFMPSDLIYSPLGFHLIPIPAAINTQELIKRSRSCWVKQQAERFAAVYSAAATLEDHLQFLLLCIGGNYVTAIKQNN